MFVCELAEKFNKDLNLKVQVRHIVTDELVWEGYAKNIWTGPACSVDLIIPSCEQSGEYGRIDFEIFFHYDDEYPQTILSQETIKRRYHWNIDTPGMGVVTGYGKLTNKKNK